MQSLKASLVSPWKFFLYFLSKHKKLLGASVFFAMAHYLMAIALAEIMGNIAESNFNSAAILFKFVIVNFIVRLFSGSLFSLSRFCYYTFAPTLEQDVRMAIFSFVQRLTINYFQKNGEGFTENYISNMTEGLEDLVDSFVFDIIPSLVFLSVMWGYILIRIGPVLCGIYTIWLTIFLFSIISFTKNAYKLSRKFALIVHNRTQTTIDTFKNIYLIKFYDLYNFFYKRLFEIHSNETYLKTSFKRKMVTVNVMLILLSSSLYLLVGLFYYFMKPKIPIITLFASITYINSVLYDRIADSVVILEKLSQIDVSLKIINREQVEYFSGTKTIEFNGNIELIDFSFTHNDRYTVFHNLNLTIPFGSVVYIVGASGSGKSTLLNALSQLLTIKNNQIFFNNVDLNEINHDFLLSKISFIPQNNLFIDDTIYNNILLGKETATEEEVIQAAKLAEVHEDIVKMPLGYQTILGPSCSKISGGQMKRISIARSLIDLSDKHIYFCDEPTSSLDIFTAQEILNTLHKLAKNKTLFIIDHLLLSAHKSDLIILLKGKDGIVVGNHEHLLKIDKQYRKLFSHLR